MNRREFIKNLAVATAGAASAAALGAETIQTPAKDHENHGRQKMKILVLTGSPRKKGNSATLANHFIKRLNGLTRRSRKSIRASPATPAA